MSIKHKATISEAIAILLFAIAAFIMVGIIVWLIPRNVINLTVVTDRTEYTTGDTITTTNTFESFYTAKSTYDNRIICRNGIEQRVLVNTLQVTTTPRELSQSKAEFVIPKTIKGHSCVLQNTASNCVDILPLLTKCIIEVTESNEFVINEKIEE